MKDLYIIKIGGNIIDNEEELNSFLRNFANLPGLKILVHGGGKLATDLATELGIETRMVNGRRITDSDSLRVATMVYAGWINTTLVAKLQSVHCDAIGLSGASGKCIISEKRQHAKIDFGFVGDIVPGGINTAFLQSLISENKLPVFSAITCDAEGQLLNTNADTIASALAGALSPFYNTHLIYCFEKKGVLKNKENEDSVIPAMNRAEFSMLRTGRIIADGMIPKLENAFLAKQNGATSVIIGHATELLKLAKTDTHAGTQIIC
jgi:acetylglutamate kinase